MVRIHIDDYLKRMHKYDYLDPDLMIILRTPHWLADSAPIYADCSGVSCAKDVRSDPRYVGGGYRLNTDTDDIPMNLLERYDLTGDFNDIPMYLLERCVPEDPPINEDDLITEVEILEPRKIVEEDEVVQNSQPTVSVNLGVDIEDSSIEDEFRAFMDDDAFDVTNEDFDLEAELVKLLNEDGPDIKEPLEESPPLVEFVYPQEVSRWKTIDDDPFGQDPPKKSYILLQAASVGKSFVASRGCSFFFRQLEKILFDIIYTTRGVNDWLTLMIRGTFSIDFTCRPIGVRESYPTRKC